MRNTVSQSEPMAPEGSLTVVLKNSSATHTNWYLSVISASGLEWIPQASQGAQLEARSSDHLRRMSRATYYSFPEEHWRRIRPNNQLEGILREIRRRTRVVSSFPDGQWALNLAAARLRHIAGTAWSTKRYLNIELL
jgi:hypothetical protein